MIVRGDILEPVVIDTKLRSFQYKYSMHIVPNNEKHF